MKKTKQRKRKHKNVFISEEFIKCPLCKIQIKHEIIGNETHIWICPECPFIGIEFYIENNLKDLNNYLSRDMKEYIKISINI